MINVFVLQQMIQLGETVLGLDILYFIAIFFYYSRNFATMIFRELQNYWGFQALHLVKKYFNF